MAKISWFKSLWLSSKERQILEEGYKQEELAQQGVPPPDTDLAAELIDTYKHQEEKIEEKISGKPYKNIFYSNGITTVVFTDGEVFSTDTSADIPQKVSVLATKAEILAVLQPAPIVEKEVETPEIKEKQKIISSNAILKKSKHFEVKNNHIFLKGVKTEIPEIIQMSFIEILEKLELAKRDKENAKKEIQELKEQFLALKMFWLKLALNPLKQSREDLLTFIRKNDIRITKNGNLVLYRRIVSKKAEIDKTFIEFISQNYYRIKSQKKSPKNMMVFKCDTDSKVFKLQHFEKDPLEGYTVQGNLSELFKEMPNMEENIFTAWHDNSVTIKVGKVYHIGNKKINLNNGLCAAGGLHAASVDYNYSGFGDTPVVVLVNPSKAITVPTGESGKMRTVEMFIACINDKPLGVHFDEASLSAFDEEYHDYSLAELEVIAKTKDFESLNYQDKKPELTIPQVKSITQQLKERISTF